MASGIMCALVLVAFLGGMAHAAMPEPYYEAVPPRLASPEAISEFLHNLDYFKGWSCSEAAAYAEWQLERNGIETRLIPGGDGETLSLAYNTSRGWAFFGLCDSYGCNEGAGIADVWEAGDFFDIEWWWAFDDSAPAMKVKPFGGDRYV